MNYSDFNSSEADRQSSQQYFPKFSSQDEQMKNWSLHGFQAQFL